MNIGAARGIRVGIDGVRWLDGMFRAESCRRKAEVKGER